MFKSTLKILPALMVAITAAWVTQPVYAAPVTPPNLLLVFTEESSTVLDATVGGNPFGTVSLLGAGLTDHWRWTLPADRPFATGGSTIGPIPFWQEPGSTTLVNVVSGTTFLIPGPSGSRVGGAVIVSDNFLNPDFGFPTVPDGTIQQNYLKFFYADNTSETFDVQFIDKGDVASVSGVPDAGTTFSLFGLSLMGLAFLRRKLC